MTKEQPSELQSAIAKIREVCQRVLELDEKATKGPWRCSTEKTRMDDIDVWSGGPFPGCEDTWHIAEVQASAGNADNEQESEANASLIALYRGVTPAMVRLLLDFLRSDNPLAYGPCERDYILACARDMEGK